MTQRKSIKALAATTAMGLVSAFVIIASLCGRSSAITNTTTLTTTTTTTRRSPLLQHLRRNLRRERGRRERGRRERGRREPPIPEAEEIATADAPPLDEKTTFDPNSYAYLIIHYHKTGHDLSHSLRDFLVLAGRDVGHGDGGDGVPGDEGGTGTGGLGLASNERENAFQHRMHEENTGCPRAMELSPGFVAVQAAPNFFCDTNLLAEYLLRNNNAFREKRGVKVVHLVRDPFSLAVSNWIYHAQYPTPELWVKKVHPCAEELWFEKQSLGDLVGPTLLTGEDPIMELGDFESLREVCAGLYQTQDNATDWSYYTHLRHLDPTRALSLATAHMMIQGRSGGDILRMANNLVKLRQVRRLEDQARVSRHVAPAVDPRERRIQVLTLSMEEFTRGPREATLRFLDFALEDASPPEAKERVAAEYERSYREKIRSGNEHITNDKDIRNGRQENIVEKKKQWEAFLRGHELFGRVLGNIERLVQESLRDSGTSLL